MSCFDVKDKAEHLGWDQNATPQVALCVTAADTGSVQSTPSVSVGTSGWFGDLAPTLYLKKWLGSLSGLHVWLLGQEYLCPVLTSALFFLSCFHVSLDKYTHLYVCLHLDSNTAKSFYCEGPREEKVFICVQSNGSVSESGRWVQLTVRLNGTAAEDEEDDEDRAPLNR